MSITVYQQEPCMQGLVFSQLLLFKASMWLTVSVISLVFNLWIFGYMIYTIMKNKKNPLKEEIYTETAYYNQTIKANNL